MKLNKVFVSAAAALMIATGAGRAADTMANWHDRFTYANEGQIFFPNEFSFDAFGVYTTTSRRSFGDLFTDNIRHGKFGGGVGVNYFVTRYLGFGADMTMTANGGKFIDNAMGNLILRLPIDKAHLAPYIFGGFGGQFDPRTDWVADAGAGLDFRFNHYTALFIDGRYIWVNNQPDYALFRAGLRFSF
jgi:hypothetical protein